MMGPEVITMGETMVILNPDQSIPLEYVHSFSKQIGGAESNVAVGLSRLGHRAGWISQVGDDPFGYFVKQVIQGEGVDISQVSRKNGSPTGVFFKERKYGDSVSVYYYRTGSAASEMTPEHIDPHYFEQARYVVVSGILPALSQSCLDATWRLIEVAKERGISIVFDPNVRLKLWSSLEDAREVLNAIARESDYLLIGESEGYQLMGDLDPKAISAYYKGMNPDLTVIVKLGERGAYVESNTEAAFVEGFPVKKVVDPIGAGDSFAAGVLSGLLKGDSLPEAVRKGNASGAITVQVSGDIEGFPRPDDLAGMMNKRTTGIDDVTR